MAVTEGFFRAWKKLVLYELQGNCRETLRHSFCSEDTTLLFSSTRCPDGRKVSPFAGEGNSQLILSPPHPKLKLANLSQDTKLYFLYFLGFSPSSNIKENISTIKFQRQICIFYIGGIYHKKKKSVQETIRYKVYSCCPLVNLCKTINYSAAQRNHKNICFLCLGT